MRVKVGSFKKLIREQLKQYLESVDRANRGEEDDYKDEPEGRDVQYEAQELDDSVDRLRRAKDGYGETEFEESNLYTDKDVDKVSGKEDISHGKGLKSDTYKNEVNLYTDRDTEHIGETNLYSDADCEGEDSTRKVGKSHAAPSDHKTPLAAEAINLPKLKDMLEFMEAYVSDAGHDPKLSALENQKVAELAEGIREETPPGREDQVRALKKDKDIDNPWAVAWASYNKSKRGK